MYIKKQKKEMLDAIPKTILIVPLREMVVFPSMILSVYVKKQETINILSEKMLNNELVGLVTHIDPELPAPPVNNLYEEGTMCLITQVIKGDNNDAMILVEGVTRFHIQEYIKKKPFLEARIEAIIPNSKASSENDAIAMEIKDILKDSSRLGKPLPEDILASLDKVSDYEELCNFACSYLTAPIKDKQRLLGIRDLNKRLKEVLKLLSHEKRTLKVRDKISNEVEKKLSKTEKEFILREEMKAIQKELGEEDAEQAATDKEINHIEKCIKGAKMPKEVEEIALEELKRLKRIIPISPEYNVIRNYIEWLCAMPWDKSSTSKIDIKKARRFLNEDHYGLKEIKERIIEYLAVCQLQDKPGATIMCFVGPPGVGKSSLGRSIARSLGRKFVQMSLGGMHDESEIRGHRRTYVGAMPGAIIQNLKRASENNPVIMLDEIDKLGIGGFQGDPASALVEVLDPELNFSFNDHYLDVPFDLSNVLFITTANILDPIPPALLDRMEIIRLPGYIEDEKIQIAKKYLVPKQLKLNGMKKTPFTIDDSALAYIVRSYTREAGVRDLERAIAKICRKLAKKMIETKKKIKKIGKRLIPELLGVEIFFVDEKQTRDMVGVATGLAWTQAGGVIMFIEATKMPGHNTITLTGQLGDVMQESAKAALSYLRSTAKKWGISDKDFDEIDLHIHVPEGATPKDGPSAGITMATALVSLFTGRAVKNDVAMTGEITLRGRILPIGGLKEKVLAAKRAGIHTIIVPYDNRNDLKEIPKRLTAGVKFVLAKNLSDVVKVALVEKKENAKKKTKSRKK